MAGGADQPELVLGDQRVVAQRQLHRERLLQAADGSMELSAIRPIRWLTVSRGHSVGLDCQGMVVAEYFDARSAAESRRSSRRLTL